MRKVNLEEFEIGQDILDKVLGGVTVSTPGILQSGYDGDFWCSSDTGNSNTGHISPHDCCKLKTNGFCQ